MFNKVERLISARNLNPKKKEGFLKVISAFSFLGIMLGVAILIIVMSVMNGFRTELTNKILGLNPHIIIQPQDSIIDLNFIRDLKKKYKDFNITQSYSGEGVIITKNSTKGIIIKGIDTRSNKGFEFIKKTITDGKFNDLKNGNVLIGAELAYNLDLLLGDNINLMSSVFINTPAGNIPRQENYKIAGIFSSGFFEYDQNVIFLNFSDSLSLFDKTENDLNTEIYLIDPLKADKYKDYIKKLNSSFYVYTWTDLNKSFFNALKLERNVMFIILTLIIIVAAFNIISGLTILIKNKTREIAILRTLGLSSKSIQKSFFLTGATIGFFASISGVILGSFISIYIEPIRYFISNTFSLEIFPPDIYFLDKMPSEINFLSIILVFVFSLIITSLASYFPAKKISKMNTIEALKYE